MKIDASLAKFTDISRQVSPASLPDVSAVNARVFLWMNQE
jgi:hypothetical protein